MNKRSYRKFTAAEKRTILDSCLTKLDHYNLRNAKKSKLT